MILPNSILCIRGLRSGQICCANIYLPINYRNNKTTQNAATLLMQEVKLAAQIGLPVVTKVLWRI